MSFDVISLVSNVGFPIGMCIYLLTRFEPIINKQTDAINRLTDTIAIKLK